MKMTLIQKYYAINQALNTYLTQQNIDCPVIKYGIDPATLVDASSGRTGFNYPYFQSYIRPVKTVAVTSDVWSGILTEFEYQLNFFTSPDDEFGNDEALFNPFDIAKAALSDVNLGLLNGSGGDDSTIADLMAPIQYHYNFEMKSGSPVPTAFLIAKFRTVCAYVSQMVPDSTLSTDLDQAFTPTME